MFFYNGAEWTLTSELSISEIDLPSADEYKVGGVALDVSDLTDTGGVLGPVTANTILTELITAFPTMGITLSGCGLDPDTKGPAVVADEAALIAAGVNAENILWDYTGVCP
jgi:hypothetical protein